MARDLNVKAEKLVKIGKKFRDKCKDKWKEHIGLPFNVLIYALFESTGLSDELAMKRFEELERKAGGKKEIPKYLESLSDDDLERVALDIGFRRDRFRDGVKRILELDRNADLRRDSLSHIENPDKFYKALRNIPGFGGEEIGPWVECELVRIWGLRTPRKLKLRVPKKTIEGLRVIGLNLDLFSTDDYPYVDLFFEYRIKNKPLRRLLRKDIQTFKKEAEKLLNTNIKKLSFNCR